VPTAKELGGVHRFVVRLRVQPDGLEQGAQADQLDLRQRDRLNPELDRLDVLLIWERGMKLKTIASLSPAARASLRMVLSSTSQPSRIQTGIVGPAVAGEVLPK